VLLQPVILQAQVDEARSGNFRFFAEIGNV